MKKTLQSQLARTGCLIMKGVILQTLFLNVLWASTISNAQEIKSVNDIRINIQIHDVTVEQAFRLIEQQTGFIFSYNREDITPGIRLNNLTESQTVGDILMNISREASLKFKQVNRNISVSPLKKKELPGIIEVILQRKEISGAVKSEEDGELLPGVNVVEKGTTNGTVTDINGQYKLSVSDNATLVFSSVGFTPEEVAVGNQSVIDMVLYPDIQQLQELVVVGYGTMEKKDVTGSVVQVKSDEIKNQNPTNLATALQGRIPANVVQSSSAPGAPTRIEIRGISSITGSNDPLWVVDGVPMQSGDVYLNPNDIESIDILKDASATAIYGARGSNGVIMVTTKMIGTNKNRIDVTYDGWTSLNRVANSSIVDLGNGEDYAERRRLAYINSGQNVTDEQIFDEVQLESLRLGRSTDWFDLVWGGSATSSNHHVTINASGKNMSTSIALGYLDENSIIKTADFKRYNLKFNNIFDVSDKVKITTSILAIHSIRNRMPSTVSHAFVLSPLGTPYDDEGNLKLFVNPSEALATNPLAEVANNRDEEKTYGIIGNAALEWEITDGLFYNFMAGADYSSLRRGQFIGSETAARAGGPHQANLRNTGVISTIVNNLVSYRKTFNDIHRLDAMAGFTTETYRLESAFVNGTDMDYEGLWYNMGAAATIIDKGSQLREWGIMSLMTRLNYTLNDRYIMTFTYRQDGSSRLAEGNKWAGFPSAALGWRISEENFLQASSLVDNLKLRLSWGKTGNTNVDPYETLGRLGMTFYDWDGVPAIGYNPTQIPNPDLRWETTTERNIGLDFGFFEGRINGAIDVYNRLTEDLMLSRNLPITSGFSSITQNIGSVRNTGFELMLAGDVLKVNDFTWNLGITFARNKNEIVDLYGDKKDDTGSEWFIGQPIRVDYRTNFIGIWNAGEESEAAKYNAEPGFPKIQDIANEDDADPKINDLDRVIIPLDPNWLGGINTAFTYRNFNLNLIFNISQGAKGYSRFQEMDDRLNGRWNRINTGYWKAGNPNNENPMPTIDQDSQLNLNDSDYWIDDLSFVRLSNLNFGYQFPNTFAESLGIKGLRTYFNVRNPFIWTSYLGMDPETGTDNREHPTLISYQLGLNVNF